MSAKMRKIVFASHEVKLTPAERQQWAKLGKVIWADSPQGYSAHQFIRLAQDAEYIALCPSALGGFRGLESRLPEVLSKLPKLKALVLSTTSFGYIPVDLVKSQGIVVTNIPGYSRESVAEHALMMMLGAAKRVFVTDRATQRDKYQLLQGKELANKTLGVIGLGSIGSRVAELGRAIGMKVVGWDRAAKYLPGIDQVEIDSLLSQADFVSLNLAENQETHHFLSQRRIQQLKKGVIIVNTANRSLVDEAALARALQSGRVDNYVLETEDFDSGPLAGLPNVIFLKGFGWYTQESLDRNKKIWYETMKSVVEGVPRNMIEF